MGHIVNEIVKKSEKLDVIIYFYTCNFLVVAQLLFQRNTVNFVLYML